jgi:Family of unknown function (DUF6308)
MVSLHADLAIESGLRISDPRCRISGLSSSCYYQYDGYLVPADDELRVHELSLVSWLNSRVSGNDLEKVWRRRNEVNAALCDIPKNLDLLDVPSDQVPELARLIARALQPMCENRNVKLSKAIKILHKKRPALIPIFDQVVAGYYGRVRLNRKTVPGLDRLSELIRWFHVDLQGARETIHELHAQLASEGINLTHVRILEYLIWDVNNNGEQFERLCQSVTE